MSMNTYLKLFAAEEVKKCYNAYNIAKKEVEYKIKVKDVYSLEKQSIISIVSAIWG